MRSGAEARVENDAPGSPGAARSYLLRQANIVRL